MDKKIANRIRVALLVPFIAVMALGLSACGIQQGEETSEYYPKSHYVFEQEMPDGSFVTCIWAKTGYAGGLSCDFSGRY